MQGTTDTILYAKIGTCMPKAQEAASRRSDIKRSVWRYLSLVKRGGILDIGVLMVWSHLRLVLLWYRCSVLRCDNLSLGSYVVPEYDKMEDRSYELYCIRDWEGKGSRSSVEEGRCRGFGKATRVSATTIITSFTNSNGTELICNEIADRYLKDVIKQAWWPQNG